MWRKGNPHALLVQMQIGTATAKSSMELPQKIEDGTALCPSNSTSGSLSQNPETLIQKNNSTPMFIAVLFTITKIWEQPRCLSIDEWTKQLWDIYTMEYYSSIKKKKILPFATAWMDLENGEIMLSEVSQSEKDKYHEISLICGIQ